jgi:LacI family transcriptional regulator
VAPRVAVCIDTREGPARERLAAIYRYASQRKWQLSLIRHEDELNLRLLRGGKFDGAITFDRSESLLRTLRRRNILCVESAATHLPLADGAVFVDDDAIGRIAVDHLVAAGFERLAYCGLAGATVSNLRAESLLRHARARRLPVAVFEDRVPDGHAALEPLVRWIRQLERPVGMLAFDDRMAMRAVSGCRVAELRIPDDVGVLGIGNDDLLCELTEPTLSSVAVPTREVGRRAAEMLETMLQGSSVPKNRLALPPLDVVVRASTDRVASGDEMIAHAIEYLRANAHKPVGTDQVADALGVARRTLERRFHAATGRTLHHYLTELRLRHAKQRLRQFDQPLVEIAQECGYSALSAFIRMFQQATGRHPRSYRRAHLGR